jgi:hypothetical protein
MDSEYNKIDDIFRKALEGATEQPSAGLWRRISGRLLWKEVARFNFTNFPAGWVGVAAAGILAATMMIYNFSETAPENIPSPNISEKTIVDEAQKSSSQPGLIDGNSRINASATETKPSENNPLQDNRTDKNTAVADDEKSSTETESQNSSSTARQDQQTNNAGAGFQNNAASSKLPDNQISNTVVPKSTTAIAAAQSTASLKTIEGHQQPALSSDENILAEQRRETHEINQLEKRKGLINPDNNTTGLDEIPNSGEGLVITPGTEMMMMKERSSGKIQKMHSLSFSLGQFFKGKYKPPKRDYEKLNSSKYHGSNHIISLAAYFAPEMTEYERTASTSREQNYIGGLAVNYSRLNYLLQGGFELCYSYDLGDYMVHMETFDSTGYYNDIGSFTIDPENPDSIIFNTVPVAVWDSVPHQAHEQTQNQYSYLQLPFMIGYKAYERGLFSAYIKTGPSFSFLLNRKEPTLNYYNPNATVQNIDNYTPTRMNTSIQILVSLLLQFQPTEKFGIMVEPTYRYYLRSVYEVQGSSLKNPYGIGIRGGIFYNF